MPFLSVMSNRFMIFPSKDGDESILVGVMSRGGFKGRGCGKT